MIKLDEQRLGLVVGGTDTKEDDTRSEEFLEGFCKFPKKTFKTMSNVVRGKNSNKTHEYTPAHRVGEAVGAAVMAMTVIGLWEAVKFTFE